ncbi:DUF6551 family protein [Methylobacterium sp. NMS12]|uniref:hypothetical protein n=1 Tax=Methylobacterium sp. NMS12 TaxID=3079766 RepID=UPI003F881323
MKRAVQALDLPGIAPGTPPTDKPEFTWIAPTELLIDAVYQRDLSDASLKLIRKIVEDWDWRRMKPPIAAWTDEGLEVIDGQHTAIAAASHPGIEAIPVMVVEATAQVDRAQAFIGHNKDRLGITAPQMHHAALAAGDEEALGIERVCAAADVTMLRIPPAGGAYKPRTTIAIAAVRSLVTTESEEDAIWILRTLADGGLAPIAAMHMRALQHLITDENFAEVDRDAVARAIVATPIKPAELEAKEHAAIHRVPAWRGLAAVWFKAARKMGRRGGTRVEEPSRPPADGTVSIPSWVPDDLVEGFCNVAAAAGEEAAVSYARRLKRQREAA